MNAVQIALHFSTTFAVVAPWSFVVRRHLAHGRLLLPSRFLSSATMPVTVSLSPRCPMLRPLRSSLSISGSHTAFPSHATSLFAANFRHLSVAHWKHGTRRSVSEEQAFLSTSSRAIRSTSIYHPAPSDRQMGAYPMNPQTAPDHIAAHKCSSIHRAEVLASEICGCFYCQATFAPTEIEDWVDEPPTDEGISSHGETALCPKCGIDSVIGSASGFPITPDLLRRMNAHWFSQRNNQIRNDRNAP